MFKEKTVIDIDKFSKLISHPFKIDIGFEILQKKVEANVSIHCEMQRDYFILSGVHEDYLTFIMFVKHKVSDRNTKATVVEFELTVEELQNTVSIREMIFA